MCVIASIAFMDAPVNLTCALTGLTIGGTVKGDPVKEIVKVAYENGINMFDTAEAYSNGESERELCVPIPSSDNG